MPRPGFISATFKESSWKSLEYRAKIRGYSSVQKMIYKDYHLGISK